MPCPPTVSPSPEPLGLLPRAVAWPASVPCPLAAPRAWLGAQRQGRGKVWLEVESCPLLPASATGLLCDPGHIPRSQKPSQGQKVTGLGRAVPPTGDRGGKEQQGGSLRHMPRYPAQCQDIPPFLNPGDVLQALSSAALQTPLPDFPRDLPATWLWRCRMPHPALCSPLLPPGSPGSRVSICSRALNPRGSCRGAGQAGGRGGQGVRLHLDALAPETARVVFQKKNQMK